MTCDKSTPWEKALCSNCGWPAWIKRVDSYYLVDAPLVGICKERPGVSLVPDTPACPNFTCRST